jgi:exonuclease SbcD
MTKSLSHTLRVLHTSDWHLGRSLYGQKRYEEFAKFLDWLAQIIEERQIDLLLIAGDVFDTPMPSNQAQELYYQFLCRVAKSCCHQVVVIGGNHDSPSFLNAPRELLEVLKVHVVGAMTERLANEVLIHYKDDRPRAIVCAVPYLRDKDIRTVEPGETIDEKNIKLIKGIKKHYEDVCQIAKQRRNDLEASGYIGLPIIVMGHLFTAGGETVDGDGVRELYIGTLAHVGRDVFPSWIDYLALGHLHVPQTVGGVNHFRYCGSPIPMGYGEATQKKQVLVIEFNGAIPQITEVRVPVFQQLVRLVGSLDQIQAKLAELISNDSRAWLEIEYIGSETASNLREIIEQAIAKSDLKVLRIKNQRIDFINVGQGQDETLDDLTTNEVFARCLKAFQVPQQEHEALFATYNEILQSLQQADRNAE